MERAASGDYDVDPATSRLGFVARHAMVTKVRGRFARFAATAYVDADDPLRSTADATVEVASIETGSADRDAQLRTNGFLDVPAYPDMSFRSTTIRVVGRGWRMTGDLTLKGVTRPLTIEWTYVGLDRDASGQERLRVRGRARLSRKDWGVEWSGPLEAGGVLVGDAVALELDITAVRRSPKTS